MRRLGYYGQHWPFPQGAPAGPYLTFPGDPRTLTPAIALAPAIARCAATRRLRVAPAVNAAGQLVVMTPTGMVPLTRPKKRCACYRRRRHLRGLGQSGQPFIVMDPETASIYDPNSGMINTPTAGPQIAAGVPDVTDLPLAPSAGASLSPLQPGASVDAESPSGTQLLYEVSWSYGSILNAAYHATMGAANAAAAFTQKLAGTGMSVVQTNVKSGISTPFSYDVQFLISDQIGHALLTDVQGVCDSIMRGIVGDNLTGSSVTVATGGLPFGLLDVLKNNWPLLAGGTLGVILLWKALR